MGELALRDTGAVYRRILVCWMNRNTAADGIRPSSEEVLLAEKKNLPLLDRKNRIKRWRRSRCTRTSWRRS